MRHEPYAKALVLLLKEQPQSPELFKTFAASVERRGHAQLLPKIYRHALTLIAQEEKRNELGVTLAAPEQAAHLKSALEAIQKQHFPSPGRERVSVDPTLIGGFILSQGNQRINHSYKQALLTVFTNATTRHS